ncbi:MAG: hypothetical protein R8J94_07725 [Acidimicrobiia bacterium]|nr:hypothetical protein [Acidimicrobiia bacterium]
MGDDAPAETTSQNPGRGLLALLSLSVFVGLIVVGGVIGLLIGGGESSAVASPTTPTAPTRPDVAPTTAAPVEVLGVAELDAPLATTTQSAVNPSTTASESADTRGVEFIELPKAVYDRFVLEPDELLVVNVAANDKIGGELDSVVATGLGTLPPGFALDETGLLSGKTAECGNWRLQYALLSTNPAVGTSWIEITVDGCAQLE